MKRVKVQSVQFPRKKWTKAQACSWLKRHKYKCGKVDVTLNELRYRQIAPSRCGRWFGSFTIRSKSKKKNIRLLSCALKKGR